MTELITTAHCHFVSLWTLSDGLERNNFGGERLRETTLKIFNHSFTVLHIICVVLNSVWVKSDLPDNSERTKYLLMSC